jgi:hypothetical protein
MVLLIWMSKRREPDADTGVGPKWHRKNSGAIGALLRRWQPRKAILPGAGAIFP